MGERGEETGGGQGREEGGGQNRVGSIGRWTAQLPSNPGRETPLGKTQVWGLGGLRPGGHLASASLRFPLSKVGIMILGS